MNIANRVFAVVALLLVALLAGVVMLAPREGLATLTVWLDILDASALGTLARIVGSLLVMLLAVFGVVLELRRPPRSRVLVGNVEGAIAEVSVDTIAQRLRQEVMALPGVRSVQTVVYPRRNAVDVRLSVVTDAQMDVPAKVAEVGRVARETLESRMGLRVGRLYVNISHEASSSITPDTR